MYIVGTGRRPGLERVVEFLERYDIPINVVTFEVFENRAGQKLFVRELSEAEVAPPSREKKIPSLDDLLAAADRYPTGSDFRKLLEAAKGHDLYPRPYTVSVMYTPPFNRTRTLFTVPANPRSDGLLRVYVSVEGFAEFYPLEEDEVSSIIGESGWRAMTSQEVKKFAAALGRLFDQVKEHE
jgi:hypothetical protein